MTDTNELDDLYNSVKTVYFKFNDDEPIMFAHTIDDFSLILKGDSSENPSIEFLDGKGNKFSIFIDNGI